VHATSCDAHIVRAGGQLEQKLAEPPRDLFLVAQPRSNSCELRVDPCDTVEKLCLSESTVQPLFTPVDRTCSHERSNRCTREHRG
jgi:hypothetical protein